MNWFFIANLEKKWQEIRKICWIFLLLFFSIFIWILTKFTKYLGKKSNYQYQKIKEKKTTP
jgi:uncharacterized membrane protein